MDSKQLKACETYAGLIKALAQQNFEQVDPAADAIVPESEGEVQGGQIGRAHV